MSGDKNPWPGQFPAEERLFQFSSLLPIKFINEKS